jgi:hypothetical protein
MGVPRNHDRFICLQMYYVLTSRDASWTTSPYFCCLHSICTELEALQLYWHFRGLTSYPKAHQPAAKNDFLDMTACYWYKSTAKSRTKYSIFLGLMKTSDGIDETRRSRPTWSLLITLSCLHPLLGDLHSSPFSFCTTDLTSTPSIIYRRL